MNHLNMNYSGVVDRTIGGSKGNSGCLVLNSPARGSFNLDGLTKKVEGLGVAGLEACSPELAGVLLAYTLDAKKAGFTFDEILALVDRFVPREEGSSVATTVTGSSRSSRRRAGRLALKIKMEVEVATKSAERGFSYLQILKPEVAFRVAAELGPDPFVAELAKLPSTDFRPPVLVGTVKVVKVGHGKWVCDSAGDVGVPFMALLTSLRRQCSTALHPSLVDYAGRQCVEVNATWADRCVGLDYSVGAIVEAQLPELGYLRGFHEPSRVEIFSRLGPFPRVADVLSCGEVPISEKFHVKLSGERVHTVSWERLALDGYGDAHVMAPDDGMLSAASGGYCYLNAFPQECRESKAVEYGHSPLVEDIVGDADRYDKVTVVVRGQLAHVAADSVAGGLDLEEVERRYGAGVTVGGLAKLVELRKIDELPGPCGLTKVLYVGKLDGAATSVAFRVPGGTRPVRYKVSTRAMCERGFDLLAPGSLLYLERGELLKLHMTVSVVEVWCTMYEGEPSEFLGPSVDPLSPGVDLMVAMEIAKED